MKNKWINFRFKAWHFCLLLFLFIIFLCLIEHKIVPEFPKVPVTSLVELNEDCFTESIAMNTSFVLFHDNNSTVCEKVEYTLNRLAENNSEANFYKFDIQANPSTCNDYSISAVPSIVIFQEGQEVSRIMGIVGLPTLEHIYRKLIH